jgi:transketolase
MPCVEQFHAQSVEYQSKLIPRFVKKVIIEAGITTGWREVIEGTHEDTLVIGIDRFGASAPAKVIAEKLGFTPEAVVAKVKEKFF